jgi:virginiamycin B lyase
MVSYTEYVTKLLFACCWLGAAVQAAPIHDIRELTPLASWKLGKTADWVAVDADAVWVASTGPFAVHRIDPTTQTVTDHVLLTGEPCAGLALGFGDLWVPLCASKDSKHAAALAKVDLATRKVVARYPVGPAAPEGGIAVSADSVWLVIDKQGSLARIDPNTGKIRSRTQIPAGSYNPHFDRGVLWISQATGSTLSAVNAESGALASPITVGPHPRFLTSGAGAVWTLNQGDGSVTRVDLKTRGTQNIALQTPGPGGDLQYGDGMVWSTMPKTPLSLIDAKTHVLICQWQGPGGDSLGIGFGAIWLTDYHGGTVSRISIETAIDKCR